MKYFDNTRISTFKKCPRKFYYRHVRDWVRDGLSPALAFGLSWHEAMDVVWGAAHSEASDAKIAEAAFAAFLSTWEEQNMPSLEEISGNPDKAKYLSPRTPMIALEMLHSYIEQRRGWIKECEILSIEAPFAVPLDETGYEGKVYIGRNDKIVRRKDGIWVIEHKTTAMYSKDRGFRSDYIDSWSPNSQVDGYIHQAHVNYGKKAKGVLVDAALVHAQRHDVFKFIPVDRMVEALEVWRYETAWWIAQIEGQLTSYESEDPVGPMTTFPKNTESCGDYGGCTYRDVCKFYHAPHLIREPPAGFREEKWEPFNILNVEQLGLPPEEERDANA